MSFPTAGELRLWANAGRLATVREHMLTLRPELEDRVSLEMGYPLKIRLPLGPGGYDRNVVVGLANSGHVAHWLIATQVGMQLCTYSWPATTSPDLLAKAAGEVFDGALDNDGVRSPWRWAQSESSAIVELADSLLDAGLEVEAVVAGNRLVRRNAWDDEVMLAPTHLGEGLRIRLGHNAATVTRRPTLGWVLDMTNHSHTWRECLQSTTPEGHRLSPGLQTDSIEAVASAVKAAVSAADMDRPDPKNELRYVQFEESPMHHAAALWMTELGFGNVRVHRYVDGPQVDAHRRVSVWHKRNRVSLTDVKSAFADAAVEHRALIGFSATGYTPSAWQWAQKAELPLFHIHEPDFGLYEANPLANEHMPASI